MITRTLPPDDRDECWNVLGRLVQHFLPGKELTVTVDERKIERTTQQRKALFAAAYKSLMEQMGLSGAREKDDLHEFMLGEYFGWREKQVLGQARRFPARTTTTDENGRRDVLTVRQQMAFYSWLQRRAAEFGFDVPDPDPEWYRRAEREAEIEEQARRAA